MKVGVQMLEGELHCVAAKPATAIERQATSSAMGKAIALYANRP
jgi:hypothetical protein